MQTPRQHLLEAWLERTLGTKDFSVSHASADAGMRRYWRVVADGRSLVVMDAPPAQNDLGAFLAVGALLRDGGIAVPEVHAQDLEAGFLLLSDLGMQTMLQAIDAGADPEPLFDAAIDTLVRLQGIAAPASLPAYDAALLERELDLFPDWYLLRHRGIHLDVTDQAIWLDARARLVETALAQPRVLVHRDYMPRNLMPMSTAAAGRPSAASAPALTHRSRGASGPPSPAARAREEGRPSAECSMGVLDFQDAVIGPIAYDPVSLVKDAFRSWPVERAERWLRTYWERSRAAGLPVPDWPRFQRDADWIGMQRHLKVIGIFARLKHRDGKAHYVEDVPRFFDYLGEVLPRHPELADFAGLIARLAPDGKPT